MGVAFHQLLRPAYKSLVKHHVRGTWRGDTQQTHSISRTEPKAHIQHPSSSSKTTTPHPARRTLAGDRRLAIPSSAQELWWRWTQRSCFRKVRLMSNSFLLSPPYIQHACTTWRVRAHHRRQPSFDPAAGTGEDFIEQGDYTNTTGVCPHRALHLCTS